MSDKIMIIQQFFGAGDVIFGQGVAHHFMKMGYKIIWPVEPDLVQGFSMAYPEITFINYQWMNVDFENKEFKEINGAMMLPMRYSEWLMGKQYRFHMESKYSYVGLDWKMWKDYAMPVRDLKKEKQLMSDIGITEGEKYNLLQMKFGSGGKYQITPINLNNGLKNVVLDFVPGYSLFDWCSIIENAENIHAVSSSSLYLFELLELKCKECHIYARAPLENDLSYTRFFYSKPYILHE